MENKYNIIATYTKALLSVVIMGYDDVDIVGKNIIFSNQKIPLTYELTAHEISTSIIKKTEAIELYLDNKDKLRMADKFKITKDEFLKQCIQQEPPFKTMMPYNFCLPALTGELTVKDIYSSFKNFFKNISDAVDKNAIPSDCDVRNFMRLYDAAQIFKKDSAKPNSRGVPLVFNDLLHSYVDEKRVYLGLITSVQRYNFDDYENNNRYFSERLINNTIGLLNKNKFEGFRNEFINRNLMNKVLDDLYFRMNNADISNALAGRIFTPKSPIEKIKKSFNEFRYQLNNFKEEFDDNQDFHDDENINPPFKPNNNVNQNSTHVRRR